MGEGADHVVIPAGVPRKPGMTRDDLFNINAGIVRDLAEGVAKHCPEAFVSIISNPVNSTVPIFAAVLEKNGVFNPKKVAGVTYLDVQRANTFVAEMKGLDPTKLDVPVIGGHAGTTILPLLSQLKGVRFTDDEIASLTHRIQFGGDEVVQAKAGAGSATLSTAYATHIFLNGLLDAETGAREVTMCAFVKSDVVPGADFFATPCKFGANGVEEVLPYGTLSDFEQSGLNEMKGTLIAQINKGKAFIE